MIEMPAVNTLAGTALKMSSAILKFALENITAWNPKINL
jgi:hypothetical protein